MGNARPMPRAAHGVAKVLAVVALALVALTVWGSPSAAAATLPVSVPITVDGDVSDWPQALVNPANAAWDGDGSSVACIYSSDRDCDVFGNEHDLQRFAWTWDSGNFYFYLERYGAGAPWAYFQLYLDEDYDGRMENGEAVILIRANSAGTSLSAELDTYRSALPAGDPMADGQSKADGYDMPGSVQAGPALATVIPVVGGRIIEGSLTWAQIGVASNSPMFFHASASNSANVPASLRDNMGGAGGLVGNTGFRALSLTPTRDVSSGPGATVRLLHQVCNTGNIAARIELSGISASGYDINFWRDADADGWPDTFLGKDAGGDGDFSRSRDDLRPEGDSDGDGRLDLGVMGAGQCAFIIMEEVYPTNSAGVIERITLRASQQADPSVIAEIVDTIRIGKITLRTNHDCIGTPGGLAWFPHVVQNNTATAERIDLSATSTRGWTYTFYLDPNRDGDPSDASLLTDNDLSGAPDVQATAGEQIHIFARASIPPSAVLGLVEVATIRALVQGNIRDSVTDTLQLRIPVEVMPDHDVANRDERYGAAGGSIYFAHRVINAQGMRDAFDLIAMSSAGWPVTILSDPDADGRPYDSYPLPGFTPLVSPNGGAHPLILRVDVPAGSATGASSTITLTGTSRTNAAVTDFAFDDAFAAIVRAYEDSAHVLNITQAAGCSTVHAQANGLPASAIDYRFVWRNPSGTGIRITQVQTDSRGACEDALTLGTADVGMDWGIDIQQLQAGNWVTLDTARFDVGDSVVLRSIAMSRASYAATGDTVGGNAVLDNTSSSVNTNVALRWVVRTPGGAQYLRPAGDFATYSGIESTATDTFPLATLASAVRPWAVANVTFPVEGTYSVELWRSTSCGTAYLASSTTFLVADDEDGDGLRSADEMLAGTDPLDADSDEDGVLDNVDGLNDSDGDGLIDALDCDSDNDLLLDGTEMGVWDAPWCTDVAAGCFVPDIQPAATTNPDDADTDNGGVPDGIEDADHDGRRDSGETDPLDPADDVTVDSDGDGLQDVAEAVLGTDPADADTDDDGVADGAEAYFDADGDGADDATECDSDSDGLPDGLERGVSTPLAATNVAAGCFRADADTATTTDPRFADTDSGGVDDGAEDANSNGRVDALETDPSDPADDDSDSDGLPNQQEAALGTSPFDRDSDDDGVLDSVETGDADGDTIVDALECDTDGDGLPDGLERGLIAADAGTSLASGCFRADTDPTTTTDPGRADSDAGGVPDGAEDVNGNGAIDLGETDPVNGFDDDSDGDGLANLAEDAAGTNRADRDSDDDGVLDGAEAVDADSDGVIDALECDTDGDTLPDGLERGVTVADAGTDVAAGCFRADADPTTTTDPAAADTDGGGLADGAEDLDGNGAIDAGERDPNDAADDNVDPNGDPDGDGLLNSQEALIGTDPGDADTDDDGVIDSLEATDSNGDMEVDALACDSDGDTLPDGLERGVAVADADTDPARLCFIADSDPSTTTDPASADSDGGGVSDGVEDANRNGAVDAGERSPLDGVDDTCSLIAPGDVTGLRVTHDGDVAHLRWDPMADACTTFTAWTSSSLPSLVSLAAGLTVTTVDDPAPVAASGVTFYLIAAESRLGGPGPTGLR